MSCNYERWSKLPYAGEKTPPKNPEEPYAGSWPLAYLKRDKNGRFLTPDGKKLRFHIQDPRKIDWYNELGKVHEALDHLSEEDKNIAIYWGTGVATKQWTPIIDRLIDTYGVTAPHAARILATCQSAVNDSFIVTWYLKYKLDVARPNQIDKDLATFICTPRHPTYPSGHSVVAGCTEIVLSYFFPNEAHKLQELADDCAVSRLYGGVHFPVDNDEGLNLGRQIGDMVVKVLESERNSLCDPVDTRYSDFRSSELPPYSDYKQVIPYNFRDKCDSKLFPKEKVSEKDYVTNKWINILF